MNVPEAVSIRCDRCGGTFGFMPHPGNARCPYCAFDQPVSAELLHNLQRYAGSVGQKLHQANEAYQRAATWEQWAEQSQRSVPRLKLVIPIASGVSLLGAVALPVAQSLGVPPTEVAPLVGPLITLPTLFLMGYICSLSKTGFEITPSEAGLLAIADDDTVRIVRKNPEALHEVAMVLGTLAHAARAAGALPAERAT